MKAAVFKGVGIPLAIEHRPDPTPAEGEVVIKTGRCGICGSDLHFTDGRSKKYVYAIGTVPGHEYAGTIVAVGPSVTRVKVGDSVASMPFAGCGRCDFCRAGRQIFCPNMRPGSGGYAEYILQSENALVKLPTSLSSADGALVEPLAVALRGVKLAQMRVGARVLILGAGPIGLAVAFWARRYGASLVTVVARSRRREGLAMTMGADHFLLAGDERGLPKAAAEALGQTPEIVFECVGDPGMIELSMNCVRPGGKVVVAGYCMEPDTLIPADASTKEVCIQFSSVYDTPEFEHAARMLDAGAVEPRSIITGTVGLQDFSAQFEALRGPTHHCKVMLDPWH